MQRCLKTVRLQAIKHVSVNHSRSHEIQRTEPMSKRTKKTTPATSKKPGRAKKPAASKRPTLGKKPSQAKASVPTQHIHYHKDGTMWAKGLMLAGVATGYWEWFRKDGTIMRSGHFENGEQVGEWITYASSGQIVKVTNMKSR
jgi:hypothetical protein